MVRVRSGLASRVRRCLAKNRAGYGYSRLRLRCQRCSGVTVIVRLRSHTCTRPAECVNLDGGMRIFSSSDVCAF